MVSFLEAASCTFAYVEVLCITYRMLIDARMQGHDPFALLEVPARLSLVLDVCSRASETVSRKTSEAASIKELPLSGEWSLRLCAGRSSQDLSIDEILPDSIQIRILLAPMLPSLDAISLRMGCPDTRRGSFSDRSQLSTTSVRVPEQSFLLGAGTISI